MKRVLLLTSAALLGASVPAQSAIIVYGATLSGAAERPTPNASAGTGSAVVTVDTTLHTLRVQTTFSGLTGNTTQAHIHCCAGVDGAAGVATQLPTFTGFPLGVTSGSYDFTFNTLLDSTYGAAFLTANGGTAAGAETAFFAGLAQGLTYLNIHSSAFPGGEIRGQLFVPEAATWAMMLFGFGAIGVSVRRRRRIAVA